MRLTIGILSMLASLAVTAGGGGWWLSQQFARLERHISNEISVHSVGVDGKFSIVDGRLAAHDLKIQRLEITTGLKSNFQP